MVERSRLAALRALTLVDEVVAPATQPGSLPLQVELLRPSEPIDEGRARASSDWIPIDRGDVFGPPWSQLWFRLTGRVPEAIGDLAPWLHFDCGLEALVRRADGRPWHGLDEYHTSAPLPNTSTPGDALELYLEAWCHRPLGATTFFFDAPETRKRWNTPKPGRLDDARVARFDPLAWRLVQALRAGAELVEALGISSPRGNALARALEDARLDERTLARARTTGAIPEDAVLAALEPLEAALAGGTAPSATRCFPVGHAHLDTAWLWDTEVTRKKLVRTASTALRTLEHVPSFRFLCTQPQQYAWLERDEPQLFEEVRSAIESGRWEPLGATWIEPDGNLPSGESFCRQLIEGLAFMGERFGERGSQRLLFLPDSFGFAGSLPQLAALAGLDTFVTNKLWWNESTTFPHANFRWRGIDGTELLAHLTPGQDYNSTLHVEELRRGERILAERDETGVTAWLQPYGHGDGGGGPTPEQAHRAALLSDCEALPGLDAGGVRAFCDTLHAQAREALDAGRPLPVHDGELYLELHRGTWTTQAALKQANARLEAELRREEALAVLAGDPGRTATARECWREVLLNQFHDILPGSGTREVVEEALERYERVASVLDRARDAGERDHHFNPCSNEVGGMAPLGLGAPVSEPPATTRREDRVLENEHLSVSVDDFGRVTALRRTDGSAPNLGSDARPLLDLRLHEDRPRRWEAWDIDEETLTRSVPVGGASSTLEADGPDGLRAVHALESGTRIEVGLRLPAGARQLEVEIRVHWCEDRRLLRAYFPTGLRASTWTASIPFGHVTRPTTTNDAGERARFEMPIHRWIDLSEPGRGLSVVTDRCYGGACREDELAVSLLRATRFPDPVGDAPDGGAEHVFRFQLHPHVGDWRCAGVLDAAERILLPESRVSAHADTPTSAFRLTESGPGRATVATLTHARDRAAEVDEQRLWLRLVESHGAHARTRVDWNLDLAGVRAVDLRGGDDRRARIRHGAGATEVQLAPFQVVTLEATLDR